MAVSYSVTFSKIDRSEGRVVAVTGLRACEAHATDDRSGWL